MSKQGGKGRKIGRWKKSPAMKRYVAENRCAKNKARNVKKAEWRMKNPKFLRVPHGTARAKRRAEEKRS